MTTTAVKPVREGFHTVTPYLRAQAAAELIDFVRLGVRRRRAVARKRTRRRNTFGS